jgi:membrane protease YdiL (CAAX protease family)
MRDMSRRASVAVRESDGLAPLKVFAAIALPVGWVLLSIPLFVDLPVEPFVLGTLAFGLVLPTVLLVRRDPGADGRQLFRDCFRLPRPRILLIPALLLIPAGTWLAARVFDQQAGLDVGFVVSLALGNVAVSLLVVNLWEEMVWAGFVQRRTMARWGYLRGSLATAVLFVGIHLPLAFYDADDAATLGENLAGLMVAGVGLRLLLGAFDTWGRRSILTLALLHATFNASGELLDADYDWVRYLVTLAFGLLALVAMKNRDSAHLYERNER